MRLPLLWLSLLALPAMAVERLSLEAAVRAGLEAGPGLSDARRSLAVAQAQLSGVSSLLRHNPELEAELVTDVLSGREGEYALAAMLTQELEVGFQGGLRKRAASAQVEAEKAAWEAARREVARRIASAWFDAWSAGKLRHLAEEASSVSDKLARAAQARFEAGDLSELERNVIDLERARAQASAAEAQASWEEALVELSALLGRTLPADVDLPDVAVSEPSSSAERTELSAATKALESAELSHRLRRRERIPNLTVGLGVESEKLILHGPADLHIQDEDWMLLAKLSLPLPLFDLGQEEVGTARADEDAARTELAAVQVRLTVETRAAEARQRGARAAAEAYSAVLPKVERNLELLQRGFEAGQVELSELLLAKDRTLTARREAVQARAALAKAVLGVRRSRGMFPVEGIQ